jgi:tetratricopeptide (TPR) repeat protein
MLKHQERNGADAHGYLSMKKAALTLAVVILGVLPTLAQITTRMISGVSEPPELTGAPKKVTKPSEADTEFIELVGHLKNEEETKSAIPKLNDFIDKHPDYSDALFLRAYCKACILNDHDFALIQSDVEGAMSHSGLVYNNTDYYSLLGKMEFARANYVKAVDDLDKAMARDLDTANGMFNVEGVEPEKTSKFCVWNLADLDALVARFPKDYRPWLFRGLYYEFFTTFKEDYYPPAMQNFQKAALLNPSSPLPQYFIGQLYSKASFWTKKAWASDKGRDEQTKNAAQAYTKAIQLDPKFLPAYEQRAEDYLNLKQYPQALRDFGMVLTLDPENHTAYADRGLAKLETGDNWGAIFDFGDAIRRKKEDDSYLTNLYENRADAYVRLGQYNEAISDYDKAIELRFGQMTISLSLSQIRGLYPEYDQVSDDVLLHKLHDLFWPNMEYVGFAEELTEKNGKWAISLLNELYEKRGDTYLRSGDFRRGVLDFRRIFKGIPNFADSTDRWRALGRTADQEDYFLDAKSAVFPSDGPVQLWVKFVGKKETQTVENELDCKTRRTNRASVVTYDSNGTLLTSSEVSSGWQRIIPDTIGEQLYNGACGSAR